MSYHVCDRCALEGPFRMGYIQLSESVSQVVLQSSQGMIDLCDDCVGDLKLWFACSTVVPDEG